MLRRAIKLRACWKLKKRFAVAQPYRKRSQRRAQPFRESIRLQSWPASGRRARRVLSRYVNYMRRSVGLRRKIRGALAYPAFLLFACLGMVIFLTTYVVPRMSDLFTGFGNNLPTVTVFVLAISGWLTRNALWLVPTVAVSSIAIFFWSRTPGGV